MNATMQWCETASTTQNFLNKQEFVSMFETASLQLSLINSMLELSL